MSIPNHTTNLNIQQKPAAQNLPLNQTDESMVGEFKQHWMKKGAELPSSQREFFKKKVQSMTQSIISNLTKLTTLSPEEKKLKIKEFIQLQNYTANSFYNSCSQYDKKKGEIQHQFSSLHSQIQNASINFDSFESTSISDHAEHNNHFSLSEMINGKIAHELHHAGRSKTATIYEFGSHLFCHSPENNMNSNRDSIITAVSHVTMDKAISKILPKCLPGYAAISVSHLIADGSRIIERPVEAMAKDREVAKLWDIQWAATGEGLSFDAMIMVNRTTLKTLQVPSDIVSSVTEKVKKTIIENCDHMGITEENVRAVAKDVIDSIFNNPEPYITSDYLQQFNEDY